MTTVGYERMTTVGYDVILRGVTFAYGPHAEPVLRDLDLTVPDGDHLAVVGPSGIGKSTLAGLVCGLLRPDSGTVRIGDAVAAELAPDRLAELRTLIPQEAYVFAATVWDNLSYLCPTATRRQVENAVAAVGAELLIAKLGGVDAELSPAGLSAGERQLIALVRAYISPAPVVVLDEATCHLDPTAERRAEDAFAERHGTLIVIAHRISSALRARRILVLDGTSAMAGDHQTLLSTSPLYRELLGHWHGESASSGASGRLVARRGRISSVSTGSVPTGRRLSLPVTAEAPVAGPVPVVPAAAASVADRTVAGVAEPAAAESTAAAPVIFGRITQGDSSPLPEATVTLTDLSGSQLDRGFSDAGGHYRLSPPARGSYLVTCASVAHQPVAALVMVAELPVQHDIALTGSGARVSGCVRLAGSEQPVEGVVVTLIDIGGNVVGVAGTEADGRFGFLDLAPGHYTLTVAVPGQQPVAQSVEVPAGGEVTHDVEVAARTRLTGTVRSPTADAAVPAALATLVAADGRVVASVRTDADGGFVFDDLDAGRYTVIATSYAPVATEVQLAAGVPAETVLTLRPPAVADSAVGHGVAGNGAVGNGSVGHGVAGNGAVGNGSVGNGAAGNGAVKRLSGDE